MKTESVYNKIRHQYKHRRHGELLVENAWTGTHWNI